MTQSFSLRTSLFFLLFACMSSMPLLASAQTESCAADLNGDGEVNLLDAIQYQNTHGTGTTTIEALTAFINAYPLGCDPAGNVILPSCAPDETGTLLCDDSEGPLYKTEPCDGSDAYENFGRGGDVAGKCMAVSVEDGPGKVLIFIQEDGKWKQVDVSLDYENASSNGSSQPGFGSSQAIKLTSDYLFVGAPRSGAGAVYVYKKNTDGTWPTTPTTSIVDSDGDNNDHFGMSIDAKGDYLIIGAPGEDGASGTNQENSGAVYLYKLVGDTWTFEKKWRAPMTNEEHNRARMGYSVALDIENDGDVYAYAGAPQYMYNGAGEQELCGCSNNDFLDSLDNGYYIPYGAVYSLKRSSQNWPENTSTVIIQSSQDEEKSWFGYNVDAKNGRLAVSSTKGDVGSAIGAGYVEVFTKSGEWASGASSTMFAASSAQSNDGAGKTIQIVGNDSTGYYLGIGISGAEGETGNNVGRIDLYRDADGSGSWALHQSLEMPTPIDNSWFGTTMLSMDDPEGPECGNNCVVPAIKEGDGAIYSFRLNSDGLFVLE